jgi:hypothetical protein
VRGLGRGRQRLIRGQGLVYTTCYRARVAARDQENSSMKLKLIALSLSLWGTTGCAIAGGGNGFASGFIYSGYKTSGQVGNAQAGKVGEACASSILGWIATGDASIEEAKKAGGITQIAHVDHEQFSVIGVYATTCTVVHGQ